MRYHYCPVCGQTLREKQAGDDGKVPFCSRCCKYWFNGFESCVIVLVYNEYNEIVLCRQGYLSDRYTAFTSGYITAGETAEETAAREVKEELGLEVQTLEYAGTYWFAQREQLMHGFLAYVPKAELVLSDEIDSAAWTPAEEVPKTLFPEAPGNAAFAVYRIYMNKGVKGNDPCPDGI